MRQKGNTVVFNDALDSTEGEINIDAGTLTTTGPVTVKDDTIKAKSWMLNGSLTAGDGSVLQAEQFGDASDGSSTLSQTVTLNDTSLLVHGDISNNDALNAAKDAIADAKNTGATYYAGKTLELGDTGKLHLNPTTEQLSGTDSIVFGDGSMLIVDSSVFSANDAKAVFTSTDSKTAIVDAGSTLYAVNAHANDTFTVFGDQINGADGSKPQWSEDNILADTPMLEGSYTDDGKVTL